MVAGYLDLLQGVWNSGREDGVGALSASDGKVPDGIRYHVLDVWVDGLVETEGWEDAGGIIRPVEILRTEGRTKVVRQRAEEVLRDERLQVTDGGVDDNGEDDGIDEEGEFEGFAD